MGKKKKKEEAGGHSGFGGWSSSCSAKDVSFICCVGVKFPEFSLFSLPLPLFPPSRENAIKALDLGFWWTSTLDGCACVCKKMKGEEGEIAFYCLWEIGVPREEEGEENSICSVGWK